MNFFSRVCKQISPVLVNVRGYELNYQNYSTHTFTVCFRSHRLSFKALTKPINYDETLNFSLAHAPPKINSCWWEVRSSFSGRVGVCLLNLLGNNQKIEARFCWFFFYWTGNIKSNNPKLIPSCLIGRCQNSIRHSIYFSQF